MIPDDIRNYLDAFGAHWTPVGHPRAVTAQEMAELTHVSGHRVAKAVLVRADGEFVIAVLPASELIDPLKLARELGVTKVELANEAELRACFTGCEVGAEPPFGKLYGLPVVVDEDLITDGEVLVRAGSHTQALRIPFTVFERLEIPKIASFAVSQDQAGEPTTTDDRLEGGAR